MIKNTAILLIINALYFHSSFAQSGWTRAKGGFYGKLGYSVVSGSEYYNELGKLASQNNTFRQQAVNLYGEYGIMKNITGILNFPLIKYNSYETTNTVSGVGDPQLELKFALLKKIPVIAFSLGVEIPLAKQPNYAKAKTPDPFTGLVDSINIPTGDSDFNYWGTLAVSSGLGNVPGWITFSGRYNRRTKGFSDQIIAGAELGYKWKPTFWTNIRLQSLWLGADKNSSQSINLTNGQATTYTTLGVGGAYEILEHWSITLDYQNYIDFLGLAPLSNIYKAPFLQIGVSAEF
jgi:hypothetical protein